MYRNRGDDPDEMGDNLTALELGSNFTVWKVACGNHHTCVIGNVSDSGRAVKCFGHNDYGLSIYLFSLSFAFVSHFVDRAIGIWRHKYPRRYVYIQFN